MKLNKYQTKTDNGGDTYHYQINWGVYEYKGKRVKGAGNPGFQLSIVFELIKHTIHET